MTDFPPPPPPHEPDPPVGPAARAGDDSALDELASALVDGALSPTEASQAQANPEVMARVTAIQATRAQLRTVPPAPPNHADTAIAAALAAAAPAHQPPHLQSVPPSPPASWPASAPASPSPMPSRAVPSSGRGGQHRWLAAAAAIVVVALVAVGLLANGSDDNDDQTAAEDVGSDAQVEEPDEAEPESAETAADAGNDAEGGSGSGSGAAEETTGAESGVVNLGAITRRDIALEVSQSLDAGDGNPTAAPDTTERANPDCPALSVLGDPTQGEAIYVADATYDDTPIRVHVYEDLDTGTQTLIATDPTCTDIIVEPFDD